MRRASHCSTKYSNCRLPDLCGTAAFGLRRSRREFVTKPSAIGPDPKAACRILGVIQNGDHISLPAVRTAGDRPILRPIDAWAQCAVTWPHSRLPSGAKLSFGSELRQSAAANLGATCAAPGSSQIAFLLLPTGLGLGGLPCSVAFRRRVSIRRLPGAPVLCLSYSRGIHAAFRSSVHLPLQRCLQLQCSSRHRKHQRQLLSNERWGPVIFERTCHS